MYIFNWDLLTPVWPAIRTDIPQAYGANLLKSLGQVQEPRALYSPTREE